MTVIKLYSPDPLGGFKGQILKLSQLPIFFSEVQHILNTSSGNFVQRPGPDPLGGLRGLDRVQNFILKFSEYGHVAYQIKGNNAGSKMVVNNLPKDTSSTPGVGSKDDFVFRNKSCCILD